MDSRHPPRSDEFPLESTSRGTRSLPARASARRRDGDDVGGTLQVIEPDAEEYEEESEASEEESAGKRRRTKSGKASVRRQIAINYINDKSRRNITFNKRKTGILKKAHELSVLTGADVLLLIASRDTEQVYTFSTPNMYPLTSDPAGRQNIQNCLRFGSIHAPPGAAPPAASAGTSSSRPQGHQHPSASPGERSAYLGSAGQAPVGAGGSSAAARNALSLAMPAPGFSPQPQYQQPYQSPSPDRNAVRFGAAPPSHHHHSSSGSSQPGATGMTGGQFVALQSGSAAQGQHEGSATPGWEQGHPHSASSHPVQQPQHPSQPQSAQSAVHGNRSITRSLMPSPGYGPFANYSNPANAHSGTGGAQSSGNGAPNTPSGLTGAASGSTDWLASGVVGASTRSAGGAPGVARQPSVSAVQPGSGGGSASRVGGALPPGASHTSYLASALGHQHDRRGSDPRADLMNASGQPYTGSEEGGVGGAAYGGQLSSGGSDDVGLDDSQYFKPEPSEEGPYGSLP